MNNAHSETGQMAVCCQNLPLRTLSSRSAPSVLVGELFKKSGLLLNTGIYIFVRQCTHDTDDPWFETRSQICWVVG